MIRDDLRHELGLVNRNGTANHADTLEVMKLCIERGLRFPMECCEQGNTFRFEAFQEIRSPETLES
jgi:hypothetical protein